VSTELPETPLPSTGAGLTLHAVPFQCSMSAGAPPPTSPQAVHPAAQISVGEMALMPINLEMLPVFGLVTTFQDLPVQCSMTELDHRASLAVPRLGFVGSPGCPVQAPLGRGFCPAERICTVERPQPGRRDATSDDSKAVAHLRSWASDDIQPSVTNTPAQA
jgi:hypothetical protein